MRNQTCLWFLVGMVAVSGGCGSGPSLADLPGSITVDGAAPKGAVVMFHPADPKKQVAVATVGDDGKYHVNCDKRVGIPEGDYKVTVIWPDPAAVAATPYEEKNGTAPQPPDLLEGKYAVRDKTSLTMKVTSGMKELPLIEIKTK